ncbi:hydroxysqualene dehydroxylase [Candidatus Nitrospira neomarina]|uniref:hydroxysqualene dehydroxylase n=1 Tax=Candidatus Nitrospira neomarina TaxID=3020899 RepID=UPI0028A07187|nr:FAD-dependent oxidoreductase [Candidatus Nitrospira neomarina]
MGKKVIILGGGIGGMSAAHELAERGFEVEVYERQEIPGGKARSIPVLESIDDRGSQGTHGPAIAKWRRMRGHELGPNEKTPWLPGEHGFRFFPGFYKHIVDTMDRIPYGEGKVSDNLVKTTQLLLAREGADEMVLPSRFPQTPQDIKSSINAVLKVLSDEIGVSLQEMQLFGGRVWQIATSSHERRLDEYEKIGWWDFIQASQGSEDYKKFFGHGITRSLVASQANLANTRTIGNIFLQLVFDIIDPTIPTSDRLLNGPTNAVWIRPWLNYLERRGVKYHLDCTVQSIDYSHGHVQSITVEKGGTKTTVAGDYFVAALPVERIAPLINLRLQEADPRLSHLSELAKNVAWMNGIQFYITHPLPIAHGHVIFVDTPWALTSISQGQFWPDFDLAKFSDGDTRDILSVDISDWETEGVLYGKKASDCTRDEIAMETWEQLKRSLNDMHGRMVLRDEDLDHWFLDPDIRRDPEERKLQENVEPLLVNLKDTWRLRPDAVTAIPNLFLAADYVRTHTDLATMEAANEAARRSVNGILNHSGSGATRCRVWALHEPEILLPWREYDRARWEQHLPWEDPLALISIAKPILEVFEKTGALSSIDTRSFQRLSEKFEVVNSLPGLTNDNQTSPIENLLEVTKPVHSIVEEVREMIPSDGGLTELGPSSGAQDKGMKGWEGERKPRQPGRLRIIQKQ